MSKEVRGRNEFLDVFIEKGFDNYLTSKFLNSLTINPSFIEMSLKNVRKIIEISEKPIDSKDHLLKILDHTPENEYGFTSRFQKFKRGIKK